MTKVSTATRRWGVFLLLVASTTSGAPDLEFHAPASPDDAATPATMRDLAERLLPVYQEPDPDRYLANLSALQMVAGNFAAAYTSRQSLRDRRRRLDAGRPVGREMIYDMYAHARAIETENRVSFAEGFAKSFAEAIPRLNDQDAFVVSEWLGPSPALFRDALQKLFDRQRAEDSIGQAEAGGLIRAYLSFDAYRAFGLLIESLHREEDRRRYTFDNDIQIKPRDGLTLAAV